MMTAIVSGATGAIGKAIARQMAAADFKIILACRNQTKAQRAVEDIANATGNANVAFSIVDLSSRAAIYDFAESWQGPLHVLVNNAATTPRERQETDTGIEMQFATNVLAYFWMMKAFTEHLKKSAPARIVNVASYWAGDLQMDDLEFKKRRYNNNTAYRQSKQADRMLTVAFAERLKTFNITVNACHPGDVNSQLSNDLGFGGSASPDQGAETPFWLATEKIGGQVSGKYFEHLRETPCRFAENITAVEDLYKICQSYM
jgi:NAD(P)-dependent dehydrogenase (short-subunit alcohol dehydrogenase family)